MKNILKFLGMAILITRAGLLFSADAAHLTQDDLDRHNEELRGRLANLMATSPESVDEIKEIEMQLKVGGVWPEESPNLIQFVSRRRSSLVGAIESKRERLMLTCESVQGCYEHLVAEFRARIESLEGLMRPQQVDVVSLRAQ